MNDARFSVMGGRTGAAPTRADALMAARGREIDGNGQSQTVRTALGYFDY